MKIVIDILPEEYEAICKVDSVVDVIPFRIAQAIKNGIVLPENHGRLIDADEAKNIMRDVMCGTGYQTQAMDVVGSDFYTPTILEATEGKE